MVVLDTDHLSLLESARGVEADRLRSRLAAVSAEERATTIVTYEEQTRGWLTYLGKARTLAQQVAAYGKLHQHLRIYQSIQVLEFSERAALEFQRLRHARVRIGTMDLKIAAVVLASDGTLLSRNLRDFRRVPGSKIEDWTF